VSFPNPLNPLPKDTQHSCVFDWPDRALRPDAPPPSGDTPDLWVPPYPYGPNDDWDSTDPTKNGVPGSDPNAGMETGFAGVREIEFNSAIPFSSGSDRMLMAWQVSAITSPNHYQIGFGTYSGIIWATAGGTGNIHIVAPLPTWVGYDHQSGLDWPGTPIGGVYYIGLCALSGNSPQPINVIDVMAPTVPPIERVAFITTGVVDFAGCPNGFFGTMSGTTTITTTVLSFVSYSQSASEFRII
jgi:hypothetical protein